jgi:hypothetical protein
LLHTHPTYYHEEVEKCDNGLDNPVPVPNGTHSVSEDNARGSHNKNNADLAESNCNFAVIALNCSKKERGESGNKT